MVYTLLQEQEIRTNLKTAWDFFSRPLNLQKITPPQMNFIVRGESPQNIYSGLMVQYSVSPLFGIPITWVTEITSVKDQEYFVDEQRIGPYRLWHHEHRFEKTKRGTRMTDRVTYVLPFGILGDLAHAVFVKRQLDSIFAYRRQIVETLWP